MTVGSIPYSLLEENPGIKDFARDQSIPDTLGMDTTPIIPDSAKFLTEEGTKLVHYGSGLRVFISKIIWMDVQPNLCFSILNDKLENQNFKIWNKLGKKQKYQGFQRDEKDG